MKPYKAPGPDSTSPYFFYTYWHILGIDFCNAIEAFVEFEHMLSAFNHTFIALIPKVKNAMKVTEFKPISLCNVVYKVILKILTIRLKLVLPNCIAENQANFVPGRQILDNLVIGHEYMHFLNNTRRGRERESYLALKLDMYKAYDRVEWLFMKKIIC